MDTTNIKITSKLIVIVGPTASGKTALSIELAKKYDGEIINGDAFQVYKRMDIGTAKIKDSEKQGIKHHMFDFVEYNEEYDVSKYQKEARTIIKDIISRGKVAIVVGGSTLYVQALLYDYKFHDYGDEYKVLKEELEAKSLNQLQSEIVKYNLILNNSELNNHKRLVNILTKLKLNIELSNDGERTPYFDKFDIIGIYIDREELYKRINKRVELMVDKGLLNEVKQFERNHYSQLAIGYKEVHEYLNSEISYDEMIDKIKRKSRNFAKRQLTWYNNKMEVVWYENKGDTWILY